MAFVNDYNSTTEDMGNNEQMLRKERHYFAAQGHHRGQITFVFNPESYMTWYPINTELEEQILLQLPI